MSIVQSSLSQDPGANLAGPTLADVLDMIPSLEAPKQAKANMASSLRTLGRVLDRNLRFIPLHTSTLRRIMNDASPGSVGLTPPRWPEFAPPLTATKPTPSSAPSDTTSASSSSG